MIGSSRRALGALVALGLATGAAPAGAAPTAAPIVKSASGAPAATQPGGTFVLRVRVAAGRRSRAAGGVAVLLSADRRADRRDSRVGKATVRAIRRRGARSLRVRVRVPATAAAGTRH